jgi:hypothetical protein
MNEQLQALLQHRTVQRAHSFSRHCQHAQEFAVTGLRAHLEQCKGAA